MFRKLHILWAITAFLVSRYVSGVQINYIKVPGSVRNNTNKPIVLDCNYSVRSDDTNLVVKWYLNEDPVYQWIPPKKPQSLGLLKDRVDTNFTVSNDDKMAHRAMKIMNPTTDIAGIYKCSVSTFADEDFSEKNMVVFEPERALTMLETVPKDGKVNFTCMASEAYPKPKVSLYRDRKDDVINKNPLEAIEWDTVRHEDGRFTTFTTATAKVIDLYPEDLINCELRIPATGYVRRKSLVYFPRDMTQQNAAPRMLTYSAFYLLVHVISII